MIVKSLSRKSGVRQLLTYLFERKEKQTNEKPLLIRRNIRSQTLDKWVKELEENESYRLVKRKDSVQVHHTILSFSNKDKACINEVVLRDVAHKFIELRGKDSLHLATSHHDHHHVHLHIVTSGIKYLTGRSNRLSKSEFHTLKLALDKFQREKYPELSHSLPEHGKGKKSQLIKKDYENIKRNERQPQKQSLLKLLETSYAKSRSVNDFLTQLKGHGHEPYYRSGRLTGVKFEGDRKFRFSQLGYDTEKMARLELLEAKEKTSLEELRDIRDRHSSERDKSEEQTERNNDSNDSDNNEENAKEDDQKDSEEREDHEDTSPEKEIDDDDRSAME